MDKWTLFIVFVISISYSTSEEVDDEKQMETFKIEGRVSVPGVKPADWVPLTKVLVDGGHFVGFVR